jgi:hypothetical protein
MLAVAMAVAGGTKVSVVRADDPPKGWTRAEIEKTCNEEDGARALRKFGFDDMTEAEFEIFTVIAFQKPLGQGASTYCRGMLTVVAKRLGRDNPAPLPEHNLGMFQLMRDALGYRRISDERLAALMIQGRLAAQALTAKK